MNPNRTKSMVFDTEFPTHKSYKRLGNVFDPNLYLVAMGWKKTGGKTTGEYYTNKEDYQARCVLPVDDCRLLIGVNIGIDLAWFWRSKELKSFFKDGGRVWDCQYAEYLLTGHMMNNASPKHMRPSMQNMYMRYRHQDMRQGHVSELRYHDGKNDEVVTMWNAGISTEDIPKDLLMEYLLGTQHYADSPSRGTGDLIKGDIEMTEYIFSKQFALAKARGVLPLMWASMDALCCIIEMEYNGIHSDYSRMKVEKAKLEQKEAEYRRGLDAMLGTLPREVEFSWSNDGHISSLFYGGAIPYDITVPMLDVHGNPRYKQEDAVWPVFVDQEGDEVAIDPSTVDANGFNPVYGEQVVFKTGAKKGQGKTKKVKVSLFDQPMTKKAKAYHPMEQRIKPHHKWVTAKTVREIDPYTKAVLVEHPIYRVGDGQLSSDRFKEDKIAALLRKWRGVDKDLSTYFERDGKGLMVLVQKHDSCIHHKLNNVQTKTGRLSSSDPNCQNIPGTAKSAIRLCFTSRFGADGKVMEADYSQLEVVGLQVNTGDAALAADLQNGVCFHCKRLALKEGKEYDFVYRKCKIEDDKEWCNKRKAIKTFSFQMQYGAGAAAIAEATGMTVEEVEALFANEYEAYPDVPLFTAEVERQATLTRRPTTDLTQMGYTVGAGYYTHVTGIRWVFHEVDAPKWLREREGINTCFYRPHMLNFPTQGFSGYCVRLAMGKLWRHFIANDNYGGKAFLINTVHDCFWVDYHASIEMQVAKDVKRIMEGIPAYLKEYHDMDVVVPFPAEVEVGTNFGELHIIHIN